MDLFHTYDPYLGSHCPCQVLPGGREDARIKLDKIESELKELDEVTVVCLPFP